MFVSNRLLNVAMSPPYKGIFFKQVHTTSGVTLLYLLAHTRNNIVNRRIATKLSLDITLYLINIHVYGILIFPLQLNTKKRCSDVL